MWYFKVSGIRAINKQSDSERCDRLGNFTFKFNIVKVSKTKRFSQNLPTPYIIFKSFNYMCDNYEIFKNNKFLLFTNYCF